MNFIVLAKIFAAAAQKEDAGQIASDGLLLKGIVDQFFSGAKPDWDGFSKSDQLVPAIQAVGRMSIIANQLTDPNDLDNIRIFIASLGS